MRRGPRARMRGIQFTDQQVHPPVHAGRRRRAGNQRRVFRAHGVPVHAVHVRVMEVVAQPRPGLFERERPGDGEIDVHVRVERNGLGLAARGQRYREQLVAVEVIDVLAIGAELRIGLFATGGRQLARNRRLLQQRMLSRGAEINPLAIVRPAAQFVAAVGGRHARQLAAGDVQDVDVTVAGRVEHERQPVARGREQGPRIRPLVGHHQVRGAARGRYFPDGSTGHERNTAAVGGHGRLRIARPPARHRPPPATETPAPPAGPRRQDGLAQHRRPPRVALPRV